MSLWLYFVFPESRNAFVVFVQFYARYQILVLRTWRCRHNRSTRYKKIERLEYELSAIHIKILGSEFDRLMKAANLRATQARRLTVPASPSQYTLVMDSFKKIQFRSNVKIFKMIIWVYEIICVWFSERAGHNTFSAGVTGRNSMNLFHL